MKRSVLAVALALALGVPVYAGNKNNTPDLDGLPDLIVSSDLGKQWVVRVEDLPATFCSVEEGNIEPGTHTLVRFTVTTPNIGNADLVLGDPNVHFEANDGLYEFATCHHHFHFKHYATYELVDPNTGFVWKAAKRGFCMLDTDPNPAYLGEPAKTWQFRNCGEIGVPGNQGISHGWADTYVFKLGGQYFLLDGGDGQPPVPPGTYMLRITVNPPYAPDRKGNCPRVKDPLTGLCHQFAEASYANNVGTALINIPAHPGRQGVGPLNNTTPDGYEPIDHQ